MKRKIGIYSGSFDPVHDGHISFAKEAAKACGLETVIFMPERFPRGKPNVSPISERVTELEIALAKTPFEVLDVQVDQFTVDETLTELQLIYPNTDFTFLIGSDVVLNLPNWKNLSALVKQYAFAVGMRDGNEKSTIVTIMDSLKAQYQIVATQHSHLASSRIRKPL